MKGLVEVPSWFSAAHLFSALRGTGVPFPGDLVLALDITGGGASLQRACFSLLNHLIFLTDIIKFREKSTCLSAPSPSSHTSISSKSGIFTPELKGLQPLSVSSKAVIPSMVSSAVSWFLAWVETSRLLDHIVFVMFISVATVV